MNELSSSWDSGASRNSAVSSGVVVAGQVGQGLQLGVVWAFTQHPVARHLLLANGVPTQLDPVGVHQEAQVLRLRQVVVQDHLLPVQRRQVRLRRYRCGSRLLTLG